MQYHYQTQSVAYKNFYQSSHNSLNTSKNQNDDLQNKCAHPFNLQSPSEPMNLTAQQHFNNQTLQRSSGENNITFEGNNSSKCGTLRERSLMSPKIQRQFSDLDQYLKQTYVKYGIYPLIRSFVDMEDQLVQSFQFLKKSQQRKNNQFESSQKLKVRCFQEINEVDEYSFHNEQNIIHEFMYILQNFFIPSERKQLTDEVISSDKQNQNNYSFSEKKPKYQRDIITCPKNSSIYNSRSKQVLGGGLKQKRVIFSDEKMIQSINLNKPVTPLKFDEPYIYRIPEVSVKMTNSELFGEESLQSLQSDNIGDGNQEQLLKTIFELRQQVLVLKNALNNQNGVYSHNSSLFLDGEHNFRTRQRSMSQKDQSMLLDNSKQKDSFKLLNYYEAKIRNQEMIKFSAQQILIKEDFQNGSSKLQIGNSSFRLSNLEDVQEVQDKQNNPNSMNTHNVIYSKTTKLKNIASESIKIYNHQRNFQNVESNVVRFTYSPSSQQKKQEKITQISNNQQVIDKKMIQNLVNKCMDQFLVSFKEMFKVEIQIQLILLKIIRKKKGLQRQIYDSFANLIDWYSSLRIQTNSKQQSVEMFISECLSKKSGILQNLKSLNERKV